MSRKEIRIAGFGGQGVILLGTIIGKAASIYDGGFAALTQSYGPESRGGSCRAEVVISNEPVDYPYVVNPEVVVILSQEAYNEFGKKIPKSALVIVDSDFVNVDPSQKPRPLSIRANLMAQEIGHKVVANIIILGFLAAKSDVVSSEALKKAILESVPQGTGDFNMKAFQLGYDYGIKHGRKVQNRSA
jgi:2-oxoglutarate ferredoxin oxidoreductase subunit gamma